MNIIYGIFIVIVCALWIYRGWSYYRYKISGSILFFNPFRNWPFVFLSLAIGVLSISTVLGRYRTGIDVGGSWFEEMVFWVLITSLSVFGFAQRTKITQGGILQNGYFWPWENITSWEWDKKDCSAILLKANRKVKLFKPLIAIKFRTKIEQKDSLEQLLRDAIFYSKKHVKDAPFDFFEKIEKEGGLLTDLDIYKYVTNLTVSYNCETAGEQLFSIISTICFLRPSLEHLLIRFATRPIFYMGIETAEDLLKWVNWFCEKYHQNTSCQKYYYFTKDGLAWLQNEFPLKKELIEKCFCELWAVHQIYDLLFALKKTETTATLHTVFEQNEYDIGFKTYQELREFIFKQLSARINSVPDQDTSSLLLLVDEELELLWCRGVG